MSRSLKNMDSGLSDAFIRTLGSLIMILVFVTTVYPFWNIFIISINDASDSIKGGLYLLPRIFSLTSYEIIFKDPLMLQALFVSLARTLITTPAAILFTIMPAYVLAKRRLPGRRALNLFFIFTMFFSGGLIPYFMVIKTVGLYNSFLVYVVPGLYSVFNMILFRTYIEQLPSEVDEAARIDGASEYAILFRIILPLCMPIIATVAVFVGVDQWNSWFDSYVFTQNLKLQTMMGFLMKVLNQYDTRRYTTMAERMAAEFRNRYIAVTPNSIRMATTMVATIPIILIYPSLQKYFAKGIMIGAIKG